MKLSLFMMPMHNMGRDYDVTLDEDIEQFKLADELGFEEAWIGEHYSSDIEQISSPLMFLAFMASQTKRIKLGTGVVALPYYHPAQLASHIALLDHLTKGRLILGIGTGALGSDIEVLGLNGKDRNDMMLDSLELMKKIWTSDPPYDIKGKHWDITIKENVWPDLGVGPLPKTFQKPYPPMAISVSSPRSSSMRQAARHDLMPISANFVASWVVKTHWEVYADECAKLGKTPDGANWRVARSIFVADTDAEAEAYVRTAGGAYDWYYDYMFQVYARMGAAGLLAPKVDTDPASITHQMVRDNFVIYGSPETVAGKILALRDEVGPFETLLMTAHDWTDKAVMRKSMELLALDVLPRVNAELAKSRAA
ncbi:LLM class flavin-dependent oxidoreductase [Terrihabitans rhizophilus]|uniref:LLM class flavin-dependent oxidoreductase n=1 Tax=Terrihabitans rhizophilus TaxID=3092662 RepID=A0ABU4RJ28_9HYPH|nr:LLM class flavin-dependent oxidoreductase [Terrihabitans sp. PJ23]MDX6804830.1 LLM class flavin-dependent oxidoreductase [Terrihabitans sp. PJ23]